MNSILDSDVILNANNLHFAYYMDVYKKTSIRDSFINLVNNPLRSLIGSQDILPVLKDINLQIKKGDRLGIIGVNGTGKTTLCRCLAGILKPIKGEVLLNGKVRPIFNTAIGIIPELTGLENAELLAVFLYPDVSKKQRSMLINEALEFSELGDFINMPYMTYSKGMQARLSLSLISALPCDLLILDEVFDGADEFFQKKISTRVLKMIQESGAVIFVSHAPEQIKLACNRLIVLNHNKIAYNGSVEDGLRFYKEINRPYE